MRLGGWLRLWVVLVVLYGLGVAAIANRHLSRGACASSQLVVARASNPWSEPPRIGQGQER